MKYVFIAPASNSELTCLIWPLDQSINLKRFYKTKQIHKTT